MPKEPFEDYRDELAHQRSVWKRKASLRAVYTAWFDRIVESLAPLAPTVELGSGSGNFKEHYPQVIATDALDVGGWIDRTIDARSLPFESGEVGNIVMIDVLHHLPRPIDFLRSASRVLAVGGRIVMLEPAGTPWARFVLGLFHHEPVDFDHDLFAEDGTPEPANENFAFANQAIASLLFVRNADETFRRIPTLAPITIEHSDFVVYPATGGFSYFNFVPERAVSALLGLEARLMAPTVATTGMRLFVVLERTDG
jgi:SAM-dependent methyltransferase